MEDTSELNNSFPQNTNFTTSPETLNQLKKVVNTSDKLEITILESQYFDKNYKIKLNSLGMVSGSLRNNLDGYTFFGIYSKNANKNQSVDFSIIPVDENNPPLDYGRQFLITFDIYDLCYIIKDLSAGVGVGTFWKLETEGEKIKDNFLINIGNNFLVFTLGIDETEGGENNTTTESDMVLGIKVFGGEQKKDTIYFNPSQKEKIQIGKGSECDVVLNDENLFDVHCVIEYCGKDGWVINGENMDDNDYSINKNIWISLTENKQIFNGMIIRTRNMVFKCNLVDK